MNIYPCFVGTLPFQLLAGSGLPAGGGDVVASEEHPCTRATSQYNRVT